jgi:hypothetical protein
VPLLLLKFIALSLQMSIITSIRFRFSVFMHLLFTSQIPLSKKLEGDLNFFPAEFVLNIYNMYAKNKIFNCFISKTVEEHQNHWCLVLQCYSDNGTLHFALSHNALAQWRKAIVFKVTAGSSLEPLSYPKVVRSVKD